MDKNCYTKVSITNFSAPNKFELCWIIRATFISILITFSTDVFFYDLDTKKWQNLINDDLNGLNRSQTLQIRF